VDVSGAHVPGRTGGLGGPGGWRGGSASSPAAEQGQGPGGGGAGGAGGGQGGGSFATLGGGSAPGALYGNSFLLPLVGGSGGGGWFYENSLGAYFFGGGGGGGAILVVASGFIAIEGSITAWGGTTGAGGGGGSGGAIRIVTATFRGSGNLNASGLQSGGDGWVRIDAPEVLFSGRVTGHLTKGFQPVILPVAGQGIQLAIASVAGGSVPANPSSSLANPAVIVPAQQSGFVPVVVQCFNVPLNTPITVTARPVNGATVSATGLNSSGTTAASTATVNLHLPRGSGILMAKASVAVAPVGPGGQGDPRSLGPRNQGAGSGIGFSDGAAKLADLPLSVTGLTTDGERIAAVEVEATLGGGSRTVYVTESGKRLPAPSGK
jgi:hypothetical protein